MTVPSSTPDPAEKPGLNDPTLAENGSSPRNDKEPPTILYRDAGRQSQQPQELTERLFGKYELLAEIGRGGMGVVFKARQTEPDRTVAVKMIISGTVSSPEEVQRFRTEAEAAGRLQHANIVKVYEVGEVGGRYFYSMEYIEGPNLSQRVEKGPLPSKVAARYLAAIARAVHHAHRQGILHRDLKP